MNEEGAEEEATVEQKTIDQKGVGIPSGEQETAHRQPLWLRQAIRAGEPTFLPKLRARAIFDGILSVLVRGKQSRTAVLVCVREADIYAELCDLRDRHRRDNADESWIWSKVIWHGPEPGSTSEANRSAQPPSPVPSGTCTHDGSRS